VAFSNVHTAQLHLRLAAGPRLARGIRSAYFALFACARILKCAFQTAPLAARLIYWFGFAVGAVAAVAVAVVVAFAVAAAAVNGAAAAVARISALS
jgi:hypothetical protein